jgi:glycosyltransferase involved in cell wall biosynthesis
MIGIPAYNEQGTIAEIIKASYEHCDTVLVVDDGSSDRTVEIAKEAGAEVVTHEHNRGYGGAIQTIFNHARDRGADHLAIIDADGQHDPSEVSKLLETQRSSGAQIVIGSRFAEGAKTNAPLYRRFGLAVINQLTNVGLRLINAPSRVADTQSGFRMYDREAIETMSNATLNEGMDASLDILFRAAEKGFQFAEIPIEVSYDVEDANTHHPLTQGFVLVLNVLRRLYKERPSWLLGVPGAFFIIIGGGLAAAMLSGVSFVQTIPILIIWLLVSIGGVLSGAAFVSANRHR